MVLSGPPRANLGRLLGGGCTSIRSRVQTRPGDILMVDCVKPSLNLSTFQFPFLKRGEGRQAGEREKQTSW